MNRAMITICALFVSFAPSFSYTNLTPAQVHEKLVNQDSLLLLDVREIWEYQAGHIVVNGGLTVSPANMPLTSGVLATQYQRLPKNIDIIVYCKAGGRSAAASSFLENNGFTRIFNMTGGFNAWTYESKSGGYGTGSGKWVVPGDGTMVTIASSGSDTSRITLAGTALPGSDSLYFEIANVTGLETPPVNPPDSDAGGLFKLLIFDPYGLSKFANHSFDLAGYAEVIFAPHYANQPGVNDIIGYGLKALTAESGWTNQDFYFNQFAAETYRPVLYQWYNLEVYLVTLVKRTGIASEAAAGVYPNPFNSSLKIDAPAGAKISIYDVNGRFVDQPVSNNWVPKPETPSGIYYIIIQGRAGQVIKKVTFLK